MSGDSVKETMSETRDSEWGDTEKETVSDTSSIEKR